MGKEQELFCISISEGSSTLFNREKYSIKQQPVLITAETNQSLTEIKTMYNNKEYITYDVILTLDVKNKCNLYIYNDKNLNPINLIQIFPVSPGIEYIYIKNIAVKVPLNYYINAFTDEGLATKDIVHILIQ